MAVWQALCTRDSSSLHLRGCAGHSPWLFLRLYLLAPHPARFPVPIRLVICTTSKSDFQAWPLKNHKHTQEIQLTLVKLYQQVCNRMSLSSVTSRLIITNQRRSQPRRTSNSITDGKKWHSTSHITEQIHEKNIVLIPKASSEHPERSEWPLIAPHT